VLLSAMAQEHERAAGGWQTEWAAIPNLFCSTAGAAEAVRNTVVHLKIDIARMQANLDLTAGLIMAESLTMALAAHMGRPEAYRIVQDLCKRVIPAKNDLRQLALTDARVCSILSSEEVALALDPAAYTGSADLFIDRALEAYHKTRPA